MSYPPPPDEPDPTLPMPAYRPGQPSDEAAAPYAPGQASVPSYPTSEPAVGAPYAPGEPAYVAGQRYLPGPAPSKGRPLIITGAVVAALLALCCGGGAIAYLALKDTIATTTPTTPSDPITAPDEPSDEPAGEPTSEEPAPDPGTPPAEGETFNMAVGDTARVTEADKEWRVTITGMQWRKTQCSGLFEPGGSLLVADVTFEVIDGTASINPMFFTWVDSDRETASTFSGLLSGCAEPRLKSGNFDAGTKTSGKIAFDVTGSTTGVIKYEELLGGEIASWVAPAP